MPREGRLSRIYEVTGRYYAATGRPEQSMASMVMALKYQHFSINGIAIEAGFSDRRNFYRVFKKETGLSPSEFVNHLGDAANNAG